MRRGFKLPRRIISQISGKLLPRRPKEKKEEAEFGVGKKDYVICSECYCSYFDKSWHHLLEQDVKRFKSEKRVDFQMCPACQMIKEGQYEGQIILENVPENIKAEIKKLAENFGKRAFEIDPMDRIISIQETKVSRPTSQRKRGASSRKEFEGLTDIEILTTENQLAQRLAKKIAEVFDRKFKVEISHSHTEDVVRTRIKFQ